MGNIQNRVFDSSGPEGKVRGTPQQIIDKYLTLARDATLGNDRVAAENFQQHAEHYARMLGEAQREMEARQQNGGGQNQGDRGDGDDRRDDRGDEARSERREDRRDDRRDDRDDRREDRGDRGDDRRDRPAAASDVMDVLGDDDIGLVETPETRETRERKDDTRKDEARKDEANGSGEERPARGNRRGRGRGTRTRDEASADAPAEAEAEVEAADTSAPDAAS